MTRPMALTPMKITRAIKAIMSPYSTAVAPVSDRVHKSSHLLEKALRNRLVFIEGDVREGGDLEPFAVAGTDR